MNVMSPGPGLALDPMVPRPFIIDRVRKELSDTYSMVLVPQDGGTFRFKPGQFNMLYAFGVGEIPISISGDAEDASVLCHTTRSVGRVSAALNALQAGDMVGVRGPYGSVWPVDAAHGMDVVFVAGGVGLAPLRPAIYHVLAHRHDFGNVIIYYGARTQEDILFRREVQAWRGRFDVAVHVTVDRATGAWSGRVGVVTQLIKGGGFDRHNAVAFVCGPEVMMRYAAEALVERGMPKGRIHLSMERNMKCAIGFCGHCQWGAGFVCRDGPVFPYDRAEPLLSIWEL